MKSNPETFLAKIAQAARAGEPILQITVSPRWARFLVAGGAQSAAYGDVMTVKHDSKIKSDTEENGTTSREVPSLSTQRKRKVSGHVKSCILFLLGSTPVLIFTSLVIVVFVAPIPSSLAIALALLAGLFGGWIVTAVVSLVAISRSQERMQKKVDFWHDQHVLAQRELDKLSRYIDDLADGKSET